MQGLRFIFPFVYTVCVCVCVFIVIRYVFVQGTYGGQRCPSSVTIHSGFFETLTELAHQAGGHGFACLCFDRVELQATLGF